MKAGIAMATALWIGLMSNQAAALSNAQVFSYAEGILPELFSGTPAAGQTTYQNVLYDYRYYPGTGNYLGLDSGQTIYLLGPHTGNALAAVGPAGIYADAIATWEAQKSGGGGWIMSNGANPSDLNDTASFQRIALALDTLAVTSGSTALTVGAAGGGIPVRLNGATVATVAEDGFGITITADFPEGMLPEFALSGSYAHTVTIHSSTAFKLSLEGVAIASTDGPAINIQSKQRAFVVSAAGSGNVLSDTSTYSARTLADGSSMDLKATFFSEGPLIFSGSGVLSVTAASKHAVASDAHVRLRSGTLTLVANKKDGLRANNAVIVDGGGLSIRAPAGKGVKVEGKEDASTPLGFIAINGGSIDITSHDKAITASWESDEDGTTATLADDPDPRVTINGGTITITTTGTPYEDTNLADGDSSLSPEGIEAKSVLTINGGTIVINSTDDALNAGTGIEINGGRVYAHSSANDAIDSNGTLTITGGLILAHGANGAEGGLDCDENTFTVTGGTLVGIGGRNSTPTRSTTTQNTVLLSNLQAQQLVLRDAAGNAAFAFVLPSAASSVLVSSPQIGSGTTYSLIGGGTLGGYAENFHGLFVSPTTHGGGTVINGAIAIASTVTQVGGGFGGMTPPPMR